MVCRFLRKSNVFRYGIILGFPSHVRRHSAYIQVGSSGGAAIGEDMRLVGINPGASFSPVGYYPEIPLVPPLISVRLEERLYVNLLQGINPAKRQSKRFDGFKTIAYSESVNILAMSFSVRGAHASSSPSFSAT